MKRQQIHLKLSSPPSKAALLVLALSSLLGTPLFAQSNGTRPDLQLSLAVDSKNISTTVSNPDGLSKQLADWSLQNGVKKGHGTPLFIQLQPHQEAVIDTHFSTNHCYLVVAVGADPKVALNLSIQTGKKTVASNRTAGHKNQLLHCTGKDTQATLQLSADSADQDAALWVADGEGIETRQTHIGKGAAQLLSTRLEQLKKALYPQKKAATGIFYARLDKGVDKPLALPKDKTGCYLLLAVADPQVGPFSVVLTTSAGTHRVKARNYIELPNQCLNKQGAKLTFTAPTGSGTVAFQLLH